MSRGSFFTEEVAHRFVESDFSKIQKGVEALCKSILPGTIATDDSQVELFNFLSDRAKHHHLPAVMRQTAIANITALAFLLGERNFSVHSIFMRSKTEGLGLVSYRPQKFLYALIYQLQSPALRALESRYTKKNAQYYPEVIEGDPELWITYVSASLDKVVLAVSTKFKNAQHDEKFCHDSYTAFLKIMLMPMMMVKNFFPDLENQKAIFIAEIIGRNNMTFLKHLIEVEKFIAWFFTEPQKILTECMPDNVALSSQELLCYMRDKIVFLFVQKKIKTTLEKLAAVIEKLTRDKADLQTGGNGPDLHAICVAIFNCLNKQMPFLDEEKTPLLDWDQRLCLFSKKVRFISLMFDEIKILSVPEVNEVIVAIKKIHESLWFVENTIEEQDFVYVNSASAEVDLAEKTLDALAVEFFTWLKAVDSAGVLLNKVTISVIFFRVYNEYVESKKKTSSQVFSAGYSLAASLWGVATTGRMSAHSEPSFTVSQLEEFEKSFHDAVDANHLDKALINVLAIQSGEIEAIHKKFIVELVLQFQREFCVNEIISQEDLSSVKALNYDSKYSKLTVVQIESVAVEAIRLIRDSVSCGDDDVVMVSAHNLSAVPALCSGK